MAEGKPLTPEKELLKLIEKPAHQAQLRTASLRYQGLSFLSWGALKGRFAFLRNRFKGGVRAGGVLELDVKTVNLALKCTLIAMAAYLAINASASALRLRKDINLKIAFEKAPEGAGYPMTSLLKATSYYLEKARQRDIFRMGGRETAADSTLMRKGPSQKIIELTQNYKLVGISWSDDPDIMIEDTKTQRTFFLKKGQTIENNIRVQAVFKDKVVLNLEGEEVTLR